MSEPVGDAVPGLRWGILGTGGIAASFATDLAALPGHRVVAVGSRTAERAAAFADRFAVPGRHVGVDALVADPDVEAVYVATPHPEHAAGALAAIAAGRHVLVEKPFTLDAAQAHAVVDAARDAGVVVLEAMWTRFLPHVRRIRQLLEDGAIGEVRTVVADHGQDFSGADPTHRLLDPGLGGGALLDLGIYPVSWASMVLGSPSSVTAVSDPAVTGVDAQTSVVLQYPGGAHAVLTTTLGAATPRRAWITGTEGTIEVEPTFYAPTSFTLRRRDGHVERYETPAELLAGPGKGLRFEAAELARCVAEGLPESPAMPLDETVAVMETMDEIRRQIGLVYPGESRSEFEWISEPYGREAPSQLAGLLDGLGLGHLDNAGCVTFVSGGDVTEVLAAFGAETDRPLDIEEAADTYGPTVSLIVVPGGVVVAEPNGYEGARPEVLRALGPGRAASMFWNVNAHSRLSLVEDGVVRHSAELLGLDEAPHGLPPDVAAAVLARDDGALGEFAGGVEAAAAWAGIDLADVAFDDDVPVYAVLPVADDFRPASVEHSVLRWNQPDLVARVVAAPPATQRAIAEHVTLDALRSVGLLADPAVAEVTPGFGTGPVAPSFQPVAELHELVRREVEVLRRDDESSAGGVTGPALRAAQERFVALEALRHACWPVPVEAAIGALEKTVGGAQEHRLLRDVRLLLDRDR